MAIADVPVGDEVDLATLIAARVRDVPDYPRPGVLFKDISPLLADPLAFNRVVEAVAGLAGDGIDLVAGIEARGFILAAPAAYRAGAGFVPVRKQGKLPGPTYASAYELEYGEAVVEVRQDAFTAGDRVLIVDDVLATGGTVAAAVELVRQAGASVAGVCVLLELSFLGGRRRLADLLGGLAPQALLTI